MPKKYRPLNGYVLRYMPDHPSAIQSGGEEGYVYEHVLIAEGVIGRRLKPSEEVHHLDLNRGNNSPNNLIVISRQAHVSIHAWLARGAPIGITKLICDNDTIIADTSSFSKVVNRCKFCKEPRPIRRKYCSNTCAKKASRKSDVTADEFDAFFQKKYPWTKIGRLIGTSDTGARIIARRLGFDKTRKFIK